MSWQILIRNGELCTAIMAMNEEVAINLLVESYQFANFPTKKLGKMVRDFQGHNLRCRQENQDKNQN
jgi:hypothetical protein